MIEQHTTLRRQLNSLITKRNQCIATINEEKAQVKDSKQLVEDVQAAQKHLQDIAQQLQQSAHKQIAKVVSKCLSAVFKEPYELRIEFEQKRGRTEAKFVYLREGRKINPRVTSGGVLEVAGLALRLASLILTLPPTRRFLALDEPFRGLSKSNLQKMAVLVETLADDLDVQLLIVTHDPELQAGKVVQL